MADNTKPRASWSSKFGFILAAAGSAVGLGNIWRFPFVTGENGGAAFLIIYLIAIFLVGYPLTVTEMTLGRKGRKNPVGVFNSLAPGTPWWLIGALGIFTAFVVLSFYSVVAGWSLAYVVKALEGFTPDMKFGDMFQDHTSRILAPTLWHLLFMIITISILSIGIRKGIQRAVEFLMPILIVILVLIVVRAVTLEGAGEGLSFFLLPDFGVVNSQTFLDAIAQAFFTLSLGMGSLITYGSYLSDDDEIPGSAAYVAGVDVALAIIAGLAIFPAVFALGMDPAEGAPLVFVTLPGVFAQMPLGEIFGVLFFILLSIAALTSALSLLEVVVSYLIDEHRWKRTRAALLGGGIIFLTGLPPLLGYSLLEEFSFLGNDVLETYDWFANSIFLPLGGLLTSIFAGHVWGSRNTVKEANKGKALFNMGMVFELLLKYIVPLFIFIVLVAGVIRDIW